MRFYGTRINLVHFNLKMELEIAIKFAFILCFSGAPAGGASIAIEFGKSIKPRKFGSRPRPSVRTYTRIRPGTSLSLSLIWSPSHDLDISFQLKRSGCMKRRQIVGTLFTF